MAEEVRVKAQARNLEIKEQEAQAKEELNKRSQLKVPRFLEIGKRI